MIKLDYQTLAIVTSILYLTFTFVFWSLSKILDNERGLGCYALFNLINFVGFSVIIVNPLIGVYTNFINNIGTLCGSIFIVEGASRFRHLGREKLRHGILGGLGCLYIWMSYINMTNTTHRYLFHDAAIFCMYVTTAYIFMSGTQGKEKSITRVISASYIFLAIWFLIRWVMAANSVFSQSPLPKHPFLGTIFFVVLIVSISSVIGILMLLIYRAHQDLLRQARIDELTGLGNRKALNEALDSMLEEAIATDQQFTVLLIDVNGFKQVNDAFGHSFGDGVLIELSRLLESACLEFDNAFRMGGDEFVVICKHTEASMNHWTVKERFKNVIEKPTIVNQRRMQLRASIGVASVPHQGRTIDEILIVADRDMYTEKDTEREMTIIGGAI